MKVKVVAGGRTSCCSCCSTASCTVLLMSLLIYSFKHGSFSFLKSYPIVVQIACHSSFVSLSYSAVRTFLRHAIFSGGDRLDKSTIFWESIEYILWDIFRVGPTKFETFHVCLSVRLSVDPEISRSTQKK